MMSTLAKEQLISNDSDTDCYRVTLSLDVYKDIVDELYFRAEKGDTYALDLLRKCFSKCKGGGD